MRIALCQFDQLWEDAAGNREKIRSFVDRTTEEFDWVVFPEMTLSGFTMDPLKATLTGDDLAFFSELARERNSWVTFGGVENGYNHQITLDRSGNRVSTYAKIFLYSFAGEDRTFRRGETQTTFPVEGFRVTPAICFDLRFPEIFWNPAEATDLFVVIASWPAKRSEHWTTLLRARAVENQAFVVGVNRTGRDQTLDYSGNSAIFDPLGRVVLDCGEREGLQVASVAIDPAAVGKTRSRFPFLADRKPRPEAR
jgi:predicted amidohydrolase